MKHLIYDLETNNVIWIVVSKHSQRVREHGLSMLVLCILVLLFCQVIVPTLWGAFALGLATGATAMQAVLVYYTQRIYSEVHNHENV